MEITPEIRQKILFFQKNEITEYHIYNKLADRIQSPENSQILRQIAEEERQHYHRWRAYSEKDAKPDKRKVWWYTLISRLFGFTFAIKLMEKGESGAQENYQSIAAVIPEASQIMHEEHVHEERLIGMLDEELLRYTGSMVLGLNDALVELTGALAGFTLALQDTTLVALTGSITGIAAALSMGASEYLSTKTEETDKNPLRASLYTGVAYLFTVVALILPYLLFKNIFVCLALTMLLAVVIIAVFNYYISVAKDEPFRTRFLEMAGLSFGVAAFSFLVGFLLRQFFGIDV